jgi:hypothetical protein
MVPGQSKDEVASLADVDVVLGDVVEENKAFSTR